MKSIASIAEDLGVTPAIIRSWQINLNIKIPQYDNDEPVFNELWQDFFRKVAHLRKEGQSFSKIRTNLTGLIPPENTLPKPGSTRTVSPQMPPPAQVPPPVRDLGFNPPAHHSAVPTQIIRSDLSSNDLLGIYGPGQDNRSQMPGHAVPFKPETVTAHPDSSQRLPALLNDARPGGGALQSFQNNMQDAVAQKDLQKMTQTYVQLVENYQALASRYSESTFMIGQMEEKNRMLEEKLRQEEQLHQQKVKDLEGHLNTLKGVLASQSSQLDEQNASLATQDQIAQVEQQIKLLAVTVFKQQQQQQQQAEAQSNNSFWDRLKGLFAREI